MAKRHERALVSIVIPIRDSEAFLEACCASVWDQTYEHWEALLIDDDSRDGSVAIAASFAQMDSRFRLLKSGRVPQDQVGPWLPRNRGLQAARGYYVAFLDADDLWLPDKLACQLNHLAKRDYDFCVCPYFRFSHLTGCITELRKPPRRHWRTLLRFINPIPLSTVIIKRELMMTGFRAVCHEDHDAWRRIFADRHVRGISCDQALVAYRIHPQNLTGSWWRKLCMKTAHHKDSGDIQGTAILPIFLLIHGLYLLKSLRWRMQRKSIESMGFSLVTSSLNHTGGTSSLRNVGGRRR